MDDLKWFFFKYVSNDGRVSLSSLILVSVFDFELAWNWLYIRCSPFNARNTLGVKANVKGRNGSNELSFDINHTDICMDIVRNERPRSVCSQVQS